MTARFRMVVPFLALGLVLGACQKTPVASSAKSPSPASSPIAVASTSTKPSAKPSTGRGAMPAHGTIGKNIEQDQSSDVLVAFLEARMLRDRARAETYMTNDAKKDYSAAGMELVSPVSNPHLDSYDILSRVLLQQEAPSMGYVSAFDVRIHVRYTGSSADSPFRETILVQPAYELDPTLIIAASRSADKRVTFKLIEISSCLNVRASPARNAAVIGCVTSKTLAGDGQESAGYKHVLEPKAQRWGWAAAKYLS
ncbi:MAG: hypothetical protein ABR548_10445 [Actinomycetota bacterium]